MDLFPGLDDVDWHAVAHAYGPADDVPGLLRGLVSDDPAVRESALDGMYGAVHHQGDVYDSTVAALPFLLGLLDHAGLPGRAGVVGFLASVGEADGEPGSWQGRAVEAVRAAFPLFLTLLDDPEPAVRKAACEALAVCRADAAQAADALGERMRVETDADVRSAVVAALGTIGAHGWLTGQAAVDLARRLATAAVEHADPAVRLGALAELAASAPDVLPDDVPAFALDAFARLYATGTPTAEPAGFSTPTLLGRLREQAEEEAAGRRASEAFPLLARLSRALGDRVEDRTRLLVPLLESPDWEQRLDAVRVATALVEHWRGDHRELVRLVADQLLAPEPRLPPAAATALRHLGPVAAPAADQLARGVEAAPRESGPDGPPAWITVWPAGGSSVGPALRTLAELGDPRALPPLRWALERPEPPSDIGHAVRALGPSAADLVPVIRARLRDLPTAEGHDPVRGGLLLALGAVGEAAVPAVGDVVRHLPEYTALGALGALGAHAVEAIGALHALLDDAEPRLAAEVAGALWRVEGDPDRVLPTLSRHLDHVKAVEVMSELGPAAAAHLPALRSRLSPPDPTGWLDLFVARASWRAAGDAEAAVELLSAAWRKNVHVRLPVARCLAELGRAAEPIAPLLREELGRPRRHGSADDGWSSGTVTADEELVRLCRDVLAAL
ncbi:HEAT repeat domain-containing protein [Saccharothrix sp. S26]|uniref:HEAT repeat domain-containing protein n=1 Tax=Saccharothrix sp. S26 TaxID=2907215 RepID=UPI001F197969|nr:HEAT repeat domain-containing protein [Saccharothrix sp. S26]MCE6998668.1 HEAT repeat domain-containing protein [Saccharothrix sp. S26]